jgi:DNA-binding MarR family transcriptional regulator
MNTRPMPPVPSMPPSWDEETCARWSRSGLSEKLGPAFMFLGRLVVRRLEQALAAAGIGLNPAQARLIAVLHFHGPLAQQELATHAYVEPSTLVSTLDVLEREGLARREKNPHDRRAHLVNLTASGERMVPRLLALWDEVERELAPGLDARERETMLRHLHCMIADLSGGTPCG